MDKIERLNAIMRQKNELAQQKIALAQQDHEIRADLFRSLMGGAQGPADLARQQALFASFCWGV